LNAWPLASAPWKSLYGDPSLAFTNLHVVQGWYLPGTALSLDTNLPALLQLPVYEEGWTNVTLDSGSLEVWVQANWTSMADGGSGPGSWATVWDIGSYTHSATVGAFWPSIRPAAIWFGWLNPPEAIRCCGRPSTSTPATGINWCVGSLCASGTNAGRYQFHGQLQWLESFSYPLAPEDVASEFASLASYMTYYGFSVPGDGIGLSGGGFGADDLPSFPDGGTNSGGGSPAPTNSSPSYTDTDFWLEGLPAGTNAYNTDSNSATFISRRLGLQHQLREFRLSAQCECC